MVRGHDIIIVLLFATISWTTAAGQNVRGNSTFSLPSGTQTDQSEGSVPSAKTTQWNVSARHKSIRDMSSSSVYTGLLTLDQQSGLEVMQVSAPSPAYTGDIQAGDIVVALNGHDVRSTLELAQRLRWVNPEELSYWTIKRDGQIMVKSLRLVARSKRPAPEFTYFNSTKVGVVLFQSVETKEIYIESVRENSSALESGLEPGDQILRIAAEPINTLDDVDRKLSRNREDINILVLRDGVPLDIMLLK